MVYDYIQFSFSEYKFREFDNQSFFNKMKYVN